MSPAQAAKPSELVRIGGGATLTGIAADAVSYINEAGVPMSVDLAECFARYRRRRNVPVGDIRCVGLRGMLDDPRWVQFWNDRRTLFQFVGPENNRDRIYETLIIPKWLAHRRDRPRQSLMLPA
jgi:hypothetical protein